MTDNSLGTPVRVLLVGPLADVRAQVADALSEVSPAPQLYWCAEFHLALSQAMNIMPQLALVMCGESMPGGLAAIRQFAGRLPALPVLALVDGASVAQAREAILAGAQSFLAQPIRAEELVSSIHQLLSRPRAGEAAPFARGGQVLAFIGPKGGVGRTTLALNTAISLQQISHQAAIVIDADFGAPAVDVALNLQPAYTMTDLLPKLANLDEQLLTGMLAAHASGIRVLAAPAPGELPQPLTTPQIQHLLARLRRSFAWIIVDLGQALDEMALSFVDAADRVVLVINPEMVGVRNARLMLKELTGREHGVDKIWLVLNRAGLHGGLAVKDLEHLVGWPVAWQVPNDQALATDTINRGRPVVLSHAHSPVARACRGLAAALLAPTHPAEATAPTAAAASAVVALTQPGQAGVAAEPAPAVVAAVVPPQPDRPAESAEPAPAVVAAASVPESGQAAVPAEPAPAVLAAVALAQAEPAAESAEPTPASDAAATVPQPDQAAVTTEPMPAVVAAQVVLQPGQAAETAGPVPAAIRAPRRWAARTEVWLVLALVALLAAGGFLIATGRLGADSSSQIMAWLPKLPGRGAPPGPGNAAPTATSTSPAGRPGAVGGAAPLAGRPPAAAVSLAATAAQPAVAPAVALTATATPEPAPTITLILSPSLTPTPQPTATTRPSATPQPTATETPVVTPPAMQTAVAGLTATVSALAVEAARSATAEVAATQTAAAGLTATAAPPVTPAGMETAVAGLTATARALVVMVTPSITARPSAAATRRPAGTPIRAAPTRPPIRPTAARVQPSATATPRLGASSYPALLGPPANAGARGVITFSWLPTGPLPAGTGYEVVWWNPGENPDAARGIAPPTAGTSLTVNFDIFYNSHAMAGSQLYWTVLIVQLNPYARPIRPSQTQPRLLTYQP